MHLVILVLKLKLFQLIIQKKVLTIKTKKYGNHTQLSLKLIKLLDHFARCKHCPETLPVSVC